MSAKHKANKSKSVKSSKKANKAKASAAHRVKHPEPVSFTTATKVAKLKERDKHGQRTELLKLIPKSGIKVGALTALAKKAELNVKKIIHNLQLLHYWGFVQTR